MTSEGIDHIPASGPCVFAVRHYHHLFDGAVLYRSVLRRLHIFVALDWALNTSTRKAMETLCRIAGWPVGLRSTPSATYRPSERVVYLRRALRESAMHLRDGAALAFFPEGAPVIDPHGALTPSPTFAPGLCMAIEMVQAELPAIPIIPVGLQYKRTAKGYQVRVRFGPALFHAGKKMRAATMSDVAQRVSALSEYRC